MSNIKIFVSYNTQHKVIENNVIQPIQTGRSISEEIFLNMIGDNTGSNISELNPYYSELTAQYWAWKNYNEIGNPDYIGFMHHHRHFVFNENYFDFSAPQEIINGYSSFPCEKIDDSYIAQIGLDEESIQKAIQNYDLIIPKKSNSLALGCPNGKKEFLLNCQGSQEKDYERCMEIVVAKFPEYREAIQQLENGPYRYFYNMFIMKKSLFFKYSEFLFSVLEEFYKDVCVVTYPDKAKHVCGYMGEFLLSIFIFKQYFDKKNRIKELYTTIVENSSFEEKINPYWPKNEQAISVGCSDQYAPYLGVYLESICEFSNNNQKYDIVVLESDLSYANKNKLKQIVEKNSNIALRFYNVDYLFSGVKLPISYAYFSKHCYYRLAVGKIFKNYKKVLFTDIDLAVNFDIAEMFSLDMKNNPVAACEEILWTKENRKGRVQLNKKIDDYIKYEVGCNDKYFNTGVMLVDIEKFNKYASFEELLQTGIDNTFINQEQCVINKTFNTLITELSCIYNFEIYNGIFDNIETSYRIYMKNLKNAKIYHFLTCKKAWYYPELPKAEIWWKYAKNTPFYEEILAKLIDFRIEAKSCDKGGNGDVLQLRKELEAVHFPNLNNYFANNEKEKKLLFVIDHRFSFVLRKYWYKIKKAFLFGEKYKKYQHKYEVYKDLLKEAKAYKKRLYWV